MFQETADELVTIQNSGFFPWWSGHHGLMGKISTHWRGEYSFLACESPCRMVIMSIDSEAKQPGFDDGSAITKSVTLCKPLNHYLFHLLHFFKVKMILPSLLGY